MTPDNDLQTGGTASPVWWRNRWMESIYTGDDLKPLEVLVAAVYADHAHDKRISWVTLERLCQRTKLSRDAANRAIRGLETKGYLVAVKRQHRRPTEYGLVIPEHRLSTGDVPKDSDKDGLEYASRTQLVREAYSTSTGDVLHPSSYPSSSSHLSPAQLQLQKALGCDERDERLMIADSLFATHGVRSAPAWLRTVKKNHELDGLIQAELDAKANPWGRSTIRDWSKTDSNGDEFWMQADSSLTHDQQRKKWEDRVAALTQQPEPCTNPDCKAGWIDVGEKVAHCPDCKPNRKKTA